MNRNLKNDTYTKIDRQTGRQTDMQLRTEYIKTVHHARGENTA
jgi:hypothetical protein